MAFSITINTRHTMSTQNEIFPIPKDFRLAADAYLTRTAFIFEPVYSIPNSLGYYRQHNNSVFKNTSFEARLFFEKTLYPKLNSFYKKNDIDFRLVAKPKSNVNIFRDFIKNFLNTH